MPSLTFTGGGLPPGAALAGAFEAMVLAAVLGISLFVLAFL